MLLNLFCLTQYFFDVADDLTSDALFSLSENLHVACFYFSFYFTSDSKGGSVSKPVAMKERFRPMPFCLPVLFPTAHALVRCI
jgi:hypothetical protein